MTRLLRGSRRRARAGARGGLRATKATGRAAWRRQVVARGIEDTAASSRRSCLVVAPHPDDETIGCGATIARKRAAGTDVWVAVVTDGRHSHRSEVIPPLRLAVLRAAESVRAGQLLGVDERAVRFLGFEEHTLDRCFDELVEVLAALVDELRPDEVLVTSEHDWNPDHQVVNRATRRALALRSFGGTVGAYPVWFWADGPWHTAPWDSLGTELRQLVPDPLAARHLPAPRLVSTEGFAELKRAAFMLHASQVSNLTGEADWPVFPDGWIDPFLGPWELAFPLDVTAGSGPADATGVDTVLVAGLTGPVQEHGHPCAEPPPDRPEHEGPLLSELTDDFDDDRPAGGVLGTRATSGAERLGVDVEGSIGIDDGELRMGPLDTPGFGRQGLAYGPFARRAGLTLAVQVLNSHNTAQSNVLPEPRRLALRRALADLPRLPSGRPHIEDNLVLGLFTGPAPVDPRADGNVLTMHAASTVNGELRARVGDGALRSFAGVQDLTYTYVVVAEERGATYYVSSVPGADGAAAFPAMRPVAIDHAADAPVVHAGLQQAVHAEVGHQLSSRVATVRARVLPALALGAPAGAVVADPLSGSGPLDASITAAGSCRWEVLSGAPRRGSDGLTSDGLAAAGAVARSSADPGDPVLAAEEDGGQTVADAVALVVLPWSAGLVRVLVATAARVHPAARAGLLWRCGPEGAWRVVVWGDRAQLSRSAGDPRRAPWTTVAEGRADLGAARERSLQIVDDGRRFGVHLDGELLFDRWFEDDQLAGQTGAGVLLGAAPGVTSRHLRALPRSVPVPAELGLTAPWCQQGTRPVVADDFAGPPGELAVADGRWERSVGSGRIERTGQRAARVQADLLRPNPGRTLYTTAWPEPDFADVEVELTPPGTGRGQGHNGRGGLVLFQDPDTYLIVNVWLDDAPDHDGTAISMFFRNGGYERLYDSPWTNVGRRVSWGRPARLRVASDGWQLMAWVDDEPVLHRRVRDLYPGTPRVRLHRVGLVANWEWGDDTGSEFRHFVGRAR